MSFVPKEMNRMNLVHRDARQIYENQSNDALGKTYVSQEVVVKMVPIYQ